MGALQTAHHEPVVCDRPKDEITVRVSGKHEYQKHTLHLPDTATLLEVMQLGAAKAEVHLLPDAKTPIDHLRNILNHRFEGELVTHHESGAIITDLGQTLGEFLKGEHATRHFEIDLVRAIRVNTRWAIATCDKMTPRGILDLPGIKLDPQHYTLYRENCSEPLPLDTEIEVKRGDHFEVQKDGKYGEEEGESPLHLRIAVGQLASTGLAISAVKIGGQNFALVDNLEAPVPPWDKSRYSILIAVPLDELGALDALYLELPYKFNNSTHPRVSGGIVKVGERTWQLVSWHYADGKQWLPGVDSLETHVSFCRGFFFHRGATNGY